MISTSFNTTHLSTTALPAGSPRVLFACGGTGGHVYPAIAIADAIRADYPAAAIAFAGTKDRMEWTVVPQAGYAIHAITISGFQRGLSSIALTRNISLPYKLLKGLWESVQLVGSFDPDVVVGTGGYVSGPVGLAGSLKGRPLVLQEQNAYAGATNKMLAKRAETVFIAFEAARAYFPPGVCVVAGNPIRKDLLDASLPEAQAYFDVPEGAKVLLVMGGSLGAGPINDAVAPILEELLAEEDIFVIWQTGTRFFETVEANLEAHPRLKLLPYLDRMDLAYAAADLAVCRSGAITCSELAATRTPAILVPSPNVTADHQTKNARALSDVGAAQLIPESDLEKQLARLVLGLLHDEDGLSAMRDELARLARPNAAKKIADHVVGLAVERGG
ncbi:MAG: undecaprenyldiphospho-muramoylpentapeptide beta-N-acetylglucosaminyltransferase, partial [Rubricoccaceae bacterium]|nr:undecaprenyldiphospho-muramoylpentapeptide beta-N-acetylglucosaminyltransferase [Rubricoccaceae bacterium]